MKVLVGISGGVDSTCAAYLLMRAGYTVEGALLQMHAYTDLSAAQRAAEELGIPLHVIDCRTRFDTLVKQPFAHAYAAGKTPNPCVLCNPAVKFAMLRETALANGCERMATGHYCDVRQDPRTGRFCIVRAADQSRDQSYMLWGLTQEQLSMLLLPLADRHKADLRAEAAAQGFTCADAPDSQEICFLPRNDHAAFVEQVCGPMPAGDFVDTEGHPLGRHRGIAYYTVGQRKGLGIALGKPVCVTAIHPETNTVTLADAASEAILARGLIAVHPIFQQMPPPMPGETVYLRADVRIRSAARPVGADVCVTRDNITVFFDSPVRAVTPGQSAVFYNGDSLIFGAEILRSCH